MAIGDAAAPAAGGVEYGGRITPFLLLSCIVACCGGFLFGYDLGISGGVTSMNSFLKRFFPEVYRQKQDSKDQCLVVQLSIFPCCSSTEFYWELVWDSLTRKWAQQLHDRNVLITEHLSMKLHLQSIPLYLSEIAPPQYRGAINNGFELCLSLGILCANILNYFVVKIKAGWGWRISLSMAALPAAILTMGAIFLPETPSFIIQRDGNTDKVRILLQKLRGTDSVQEELNDLVSASNLSRTTRYPFRNIFKRKYRPQFVITLLIPFFNQVTGINVINFYAPVMFRTVGLKENASLLSSVVTRLCATFANIVAMMLVDRSGRRKLLLVGSIQMILSQFTVGAILAEKFKDHGEMEKDYAYLVLIIMCVFVAGYGWSWGPLTFLVPAEVCPLEIRSAGQSIVVAVTFLMTFVISQTFLVVLCHIKSATFFVFGVWIGLMAIFVYLFLPETKNLPMEQVKHLWRRHCFWKNIVSEEQEEKKQAGTTALPSS
ncbi:hypothetical protein PVAP13_9NG469800 [Panicum virgatum]|uniref:Major facilitator superfamily (MFS) profile domain-containing protein n=2 Tax=Panicum virgatum TaxID=38727 RepID=A0A8T0MQQ5_PANVG|nr:hypothetical protein PVAP13_9NG469800 [Panicum virgatum]